MDLSKNIKPSATVGILDKARELAASGHKVINMGIGEVMCDSPPQALEGLEAALRSGYTHYVPSQGIPELRRAIAEKLLSENGIDVDPDNIIVTPGAKYALYLAMLTIIDKEDEVIVADPGWVTYEAIISMAGGTTVYVPVKEEDDFRLLANRVADYVSPKTKAVIINTPSNPTGGVLLKSDLQQIGSLAARHNLYVIADEIYEKFVYDGKKHESIGALAELKERVITINGWSKGWAMTGWRIGYAAAPADIIRKMTVAQQHTVTCTCGFTQKGALASLESSSEFVSQLVQETEAKRNYVVDALNALPGVRCRKPPGAFYAFANIIGTGRDAEDLSRLLLDKAGVITLPGSTFGVHGKEYLRFSYALPWEDIREGMSRVTEVLGND